MVLPTGGALNALNERHRVNARSNSVPVMQLVRNHNPRTPRQLKELIEMHYLQPCACGVVSQGPVERFTMNLFEAQFKDAVFLDQHSRHSWEQCFEFTHALFCVAPLRGDRQERKSQSVVCEALDAVVRSHFQIRENDAIRRCLVRDRLHICRHAFARRCLGVQVKPATCPRDILRYNAKKAKRARHELLFHIYDTDGSFQRDSTDAIVTFLSRLCDASSEDTSSSNASTADVS